MQNNDEIPISPKKACDIVLKGGITSGVVYPKAILEIAKNFKFKCIGGTSAGAIAAGLTAAAEYSRTKNSNSEGFNILGKLPEMLTSKENKETKLLSLFKPNKNTKKYYNTILPFLNKKGAFSKISFGLFKIIFSKPLVTAFVFLLFLILEYLFVNSGNPAPFIAGTGLNLICTILVLILLNTFLFIKNLNKEIENNFFGLTKGHFSEEEKKKEKTESLTDWLADLIDKVAEKPFNEPLTFGDLSKSEEKEGITLRMVTTNLNQGVPKALPFIKRRESDKPIYYFKEEDFLELFPKRIIDCMKKDNPKTEDDFYVLPDSDKLPVIVGVRMSLSFPVLISAVPIYVLNGKTQVKEKCWFSDGGICSNFPVHFFDSPLPTRPTFAINLRPMDKTDSVQSKNISMPKSNNDGLEYEWYKNENSLISFLSSIIKTMQNWNDISQIRLPGYRDRVCNVYLSKEEGGLNLNMEKELIKNLCERGRYAGIELRERFSTAGYSKMNWDNHKWIRVRTTLALLQKYLMDMQNAYVKYPYEDEVDYRNLIGRDKDTPPNSYEMGKNQKLFILNELEEIFKIVGKWEEKEKINSFNTFGGEHVPRPKPELRIKPVM